MQLSHHLVLASSSIATCVIRPHEASWWACCFSDCETSTRAQLASGSRPDVVEPHETLFQQLTPFHPGDRAGQRQVFLWKQMAADFFSRNLRTACLNCRGPHACDSFRRHLSVDGAISYLYPFWNLLRVLPFALVLTTSGCIMLYLLFVIFLNWTHWGRFRTVNLLAPYLLEDC